MTCLVGSSHSSHHPAKFVGPVPCESEGKIFLICHMTIQLKCQVTLWVDFLHPKSPPAKFGVHRPFECGDITFLIFHVTTQLMCHVTW